MKKPFLLLCIITIAIGITPYAMADLIDFETGFSDLDPVGTVTTSTNEVEFFVGASPLTLGTGFIARVGGPLRTSFVPNDLPAVVAVAGEYFLTDEINGPFAALNYYMVFVDLPINALSLDLFDYRVDGGPAAGDGATLTVYENSNFSGSSASDTFIIPTPNPVDGNIENLSVSSFGFAARSATLTFDGPDVGTGIDNIAFTSVPEPTSLLLVGIGMLGLAGYGRRKFKKKL